MPLLAIASGPPINYEEWGDPAAPAVVLLHDLLGDLRAWGELAGALAGNYRVIAPDLRGLGLTPPAAEPAAVTVESLAYDVEALLDGLGVDLAAVVGCGLGGVAALRFALASPARVPGLALADTAAAPEHPRYDDACRARRAALHDDAAFAARYGMARLGKRAATSVGGRFLAEGLLQRYAAVPLEGFLAACRALHTCPDLFPELPGLAVPALVCWGEFSPALSASEAIAAALPEARAVVFRDCAYGAPWQRPDAFAAQLRAFLHDLEEGRPIPGRRTV